MDQMPKLPEGWTAWGSLPSFNPAHGSLSEQQLFELSEDLWHATSPDHTETLDVGWYPEAEEDGQFTCRAVRGDDWEKAETFSTRDLNAVCQWIEAKLANLSAPDPRLCFGR